MVKNSLEDLARVFHNFRMLVDEGQKEFITALRAPSQAIVTREYVKKLLIETYDVFNEMSTEDYTQALAMIYDISVIDSKNTQKAKVSNA